MMEHHADGASWNQSQSPLKDQNDLDPLFDQFTNEAWFCQTNLPIDNALWLDLQTATEPTLVDSVVAHTTTEQQDILQTDEQADDSSGPRTASPWSGFQSSAYSSDQPISPVKIGTRFSKESVKILKKWLATHKSHPYPNEKEKIVLQQQTGLSRVQISNWLANARRRGKALPSPSLPSASPGSKTSPVDIPKRPSTPAVGYSSILNPLQRWVDSPPESEPATASAIAQAIASNSGMPISLNNFEDSNGPTYQASSAGSISTSRSSGGSLASAHSFDSQNSRSSVPFNRGHRLRGRRARKEWNDRKTSLNTLAKTFQCTFCTESFRTKYDWQRHEKALHITLEKWVCAPDGPCAVDPSTKDLSCVFCGKPNPDGAHMDSHNLVSCRERTENERTFYRKDHLTQHLRLVHESKFLEKSMNGWKVVIKDIKSRCGFCNASMSTWSDRIDHLARHFKNGRTMAEWEGGWGFEPHVMGMVENYIPPYLVEQERNSPFPFQASRPPSETPRSAYELIKLELVYSMQNRYDETGVMPNNQDIHLEACRIIFASETSSFHSAMEGSSWLRDLIMSDEIISRRAQLGPVRSSVEARLYLLKIHGKDNLFRECPLESQLQEFFHRRYSSGIAPSDDELRREACEVIGRVEAQSPMPSDFIANWLIKLVASSTGWINDFRQRMQSASCGDMMLGSPQPLDTDIALLSIMNGDGAFEGQASPLGTAQAQACNSDENNPLVLNQKGNVGIFYSFDYESMCYPAVTAPDSRRLLTKPNSNMGSQDSAGGSRPTLFLPGRMFAHDGNLHRWLGRDLRRWVACAMSPNNPNRHIPTDEEIQHQSLWILYGDDDPWNETPAHNAQWLKEFKEEVGIPLEHPDAD